MSSPSGNLPVRGRESKQINDGVSPLDMLKQKKASYASPGKRSPKPNTQSVHIRKDHKLSEEQRKRIEEEETELERQLMLSRLKDEVIVGMERARRVEELSGQIPRQEYTRGLALSPERPSNNT